MKDDKDNLDQPKAVGGAPDDSGHSDLLRSAIDDLVRRGVIEVAIDREGVTRYRFPNLETGARLLRESREGGQ